MSELASQINARKARLQRFAEAATRYADKGRLLADIQQVALLELPFTPPKVRRAYEKAGQPSICIPVTWRVLGAVANEFGMTVEEIRSRHREPKYTLPRFVAIGLLLDLTKLSLPAIGRQLGGRDHTTIINGRNRLAKLLESESFRNRFEQIKGGLARERIIS